MPYCGCARRNHQDKSLLSASVALTEISCYIIAGHGGHVTKPNNLLNVICNPQDRICYSLKRQKLGMPTEQVDNQ